MAGSEQSDVTPDEGARDACDARDGLDAREAKGAHEAFDAPRGVSFANPPAFLGRWLAAWTFTLPRVAPSRWHVAADNRRVADMIQHRFVVETDDGEQLVAVHFPAQETGVDREGRSTTRRIEKAGLPVVFAHGWTESKAFHYRLARLLTSRGHDVVLFDQRAHGESTGRFTTLGVREPDDIRAVIDAANQRGFIGERVMLSGVSMGGASVLSLATREPRAAGVVSYAPFASFLGAIRSYHRRYVPRLGEQWGRWAVRGFEEASRRRGFDIRESAPIETVAQIDAPVLIVAGGCDVNLPPAEHAHLLAEAHGDAELITAEHATHFNICMTAWPEADNALLAFCQRVSAAE